MTTIQRQLDKLADFVGHIRSTESTSDKALHTLQESIQGALETMNGTLETWCINLTQHCETFSRTVHENSSQNAKAVGTAIRSMAELMQTTLQELQSYLKQEHAAWADCHKGAGNTATAEVRYFLNAEIFAYTARKLERLRNQNQMLTQLLENERVQAERAKKDVVQHITSLLGDFIQHRDQRLQSTIHEVQQSIAQGESSMGGLLATQTEKWEIGMKRRVDWEMALNEYEANGQRIRVRGDEVSLYLINRDSTHSKEQRLYHMSSKRLGKVSQQYSLTYLIRYLNKRVTRRKKQVILTASAPKVSVGLITVRFYSSSNHLQPSPNLDVQSACVLRLYKDCKNNKQKVLRR